MDKIKFSAVRLAAAGVFCAVLTFANTADAGWRQRMRGLMNRGSHGGHGHAGGCHGGGQSYGASGCSQSAPMISCSNCCAPSGGYVGGCGENSNGCYSMNSYPHENMGHNGYSGPYNNNAGPNNNTGPNGDYQDGNQSMDRTDGTGRSTQSDQSQAGDNTMNRDNNIPPNASESPNDRPPSSQNSTTQGAGTGRST